VSTSTSFPAFESDGYAGKRLGRFEVMCKLGAGGMSEVFLAWQKAVGGFQRAVVLKRILEAVKRNEDFLRMFVKEAKITSSLSHGGIAHLYELAHEDGELFMVMEFVPGATLVEVARACHHAHEPIPIGFTLSVIRDTALALQYAHTFADPTGRVRPVIHRDIAEKNIMVSFDGTVKLLDFGIARVADQETMTRAGTVKGTAGYMSPEQVRGEKLDVRTDLFSLGVVMHECLTGQRLFRRNSLPEEVQALLEAPIVPPSAKNPQINANLDAIVMKALQRDRAVRWASAKDIVEAIEGAAGSSMWTQARRSEFITRHFERRQQDITSMLGDPAATDLGDLLPPSRNRTTRDDFKTVNARPLGEERTVEVRTLAGKIPEPQPEGKQVTRDRSGLGQRTAKVEALDEKGNVREVLSAPPALKGGRQYSAQREDSTVSSHPGVEGRSESTASVPAIKVVELDEGGTVIEPSEAETEEAGSDERLQPQRIRLKNIAAQKQALLMWIAIGSGLVLGVVLAAFLIFG
jgi:serine/threonine protein kinase